MRACCLVAPLAVTMAALTACASEAAINEETEARERFIRGLAEREGVDDVWYVMSRADVVFEDGWSAAQMVDPGPSVRWNELAQASGSVRTIPVRWLGPSGHLRLRARSPVDMHLRVWGAVNLNVLFTRPRVTVTYDGLEFYSQVVGNDGEFTVEAVIPAEWRHGWADVYVTLSSVGEPWREASSLRAARVEGVTWEPVP